jgi:hypothetical protein
VRERGRGFGRGRSGDDRPVSGDDVADCVHDGERGDLRAVDFRRRDSESAVDRVVAAAPLPDRRAGRGADPAGCECLVARRGDACFVAVCVARRGAVDLGEVEDACGRDDRHRPAGRRIALSALGQVAHHAVGRREAERGSAREHDGVDACNRARRIEHVELARRRRAPAQLGGPHGTRRQQHDGDARAGACAVTDAHALNGKARHGSTPLGPD